MSPKDHEAPAPVQDALIIQEWEHLNGFDPESRTYQLTEAEREFAPERRSHRDRYNFDGRVRPLNAKI